MPLLQIPSESPFAIDEPVCCAELDIEGAGSVVLSWPGAGPRETASAVLGDVVALGGARNKAAVARGKTAGVALGGLPSEASRTPAPTR